MHNKVFCESQAAQDGAIVSQRVSATRPDLIINISLSVIINIMPLPKGFIKYGRNGHGVLFGNREKLCKGFHADHCSTL